MSALSRSRLIAESRWLIASVCNRLQASSGDASRVPAPGARVSWPRADHLRSRETGWRLDRDRLARPESAAGGVTRHTAEGDERRRSSRLHAERRGQRTCARSRPASCSSRCPTSPTRFGLILLRGIEDAAQRRRLLRAARRHAARRGARGRLCDDAAAEEADGLILLGTSAEGGRRASAPRCSRGSCADRQRLRVRSWRSLGVPSVHIDNAKGGLGSDGPPLSSRHRRAASSPGRWSVRCRATGCAARHVARRRKNGPARPHRHDRRLLHRVGAGRRRAAPRPSGAADRHLLFQRRDGDGRDSAERRRGSGFQNAVGRRLRRHPLRSYIGPTA